MKVFTISDAHVERTRNKNVDRFCELAIEAKPDLAVLNGDIFDCWAEELDHIAESPTFGSVKTLTEYVETVYVMGDHDVEWSEIKTLLPKAEFRDVFFEIGGIRFEHGHYYDVPSWAWWFPWAKGILDIIPQQVLIWIYNNIFRRLRYQPHKYSNMSLRGFNAENIGAIRCLSHWAAHVNDKRGVKNLVLGHSHLAERWVNNVGCNLYNTGSIRDSGSYLLIRDGEFILKTV